ncbi:MAG: hypothetical protein ACTJG2_01915 [Candidatus Saccharimonadales bacterium]
MARSLAVLLGRSRDVLFLQTIEQLEAATGQSGVDVRLVGELLEAAHTTARELGLDSNDSTALELYNALRSQAKKLPSRGAALRIGMTVQGTVLSFNQKDLLDDEANGASLSQRSLQHMQTALLTELKRRYEKAAGDRNRVAARLLASL